MPRRTLLSSLLLVVGCAGHSGERHFVCGTGTEDMASGRHVPLPGALAVPGLIEAEAFHGARGWREIEKDPAASGKRVVRMRGAARLSYQIDVAEAGDYEPSLNGAAPSFLGGEVELWLDGRPVSDRRSLGGHLYPSTAYVFEKVTLAAGPHLLEVVSRASALATVTIDWMRFEIDRGVIGAYLRDARPPGPEWRGPCRYGSAKAAAADKAIEALDARIRRVRDRRALAEVQDRLGKLLGSECFALSRHEMHEWTTSSVGAFQTWWRDGGRRWVESYVSIGDHVPVTVVLPPDVRTSMAPGDAAPSGGKYARHEPLLPAANALLCPFDAPAACGADTRAFRLRWERFSAADWRDSADCTPLARRDRYVEWHDCLAAHRPVLQALPLGEARAPRGGWLVLTDRFAWHCARTRAYHLDSGSSHVVEQCWKGAEHGPYRKIVKGGTVQTEAIRELLWMLLFANQIERRQVEATWAQLPPGVAVRQAPRGGSFESAAALAFDAGRDDDIRPIHTSVLDWRWQDGPTARAAGQRVWTPSPANRYLDLLVEELDAGFADGHPAQPLPPGIEASDDIDRPAR